MKMFLKEFKGAIILHSSWDTRNFNRVNYQKHKVSHSIYLQRFYQTLLPPTKIKWYLKNLRYLKISDIELQDCIYILFHSAVQLVIFNSIRMKEKIKIFKDPRYSFEILKIAFEFALNLVIINSVYKKKIVQDYRYWR